MLGLIRTRQGEEHPDTIISAGPPSLYIYNKIKMSETYRMKLFIYLFLKKEKVSQSKVKKEKRGEVRYLALEGYEQPAVPVRKKLKTCNVM